MKISPARTAAFDVLLRIEKERAYSSVLLPFVEDGLSAVDRSLCHELTLGTLRRQMYLDRLIDLFAGGKKIDIEVRIALRLGLYQLYFLDRIPQYSAIDESVNLVKRAKKTSAKGFANAILRRATRERPGIVFADEIDRISIETSHPRWLIEKWINDLGVDKALSLANANNEVANSAFRYLGGIPVESGLKGVRKSEFVDGCFVSDRIDDQLLALAAGGEIYFQDEASQMVALSVTIPDKGYFLDVCAAPGGKTGLIEFRHRARAFVAAGDIHWQRVEMLRDNCRRQGAGEVAVVQYDAQEELPFANDSFDTVFVDAPCTGTGTIKHNPEIRYFLEPEDLAALPLKQLSILKNASKLVKPGGLLVYATCSLEQEENEAVCKDFISIAPQFEFVGPDLQSRFLSGPFARTWPDRDNMDGFFTAHLRRTNAA
jgi:16S rRNA (cytosine967-C5)-methyltransferase